jgi:VWFA-related protein
MTFGKRSWPVWVSAASLAAGAVTFGQGAQQPVFRASVNLVHVEVVVVDSTGQPVKGLSKDVFRVLDRRQPQTVSVFEEVTRDPASFAAPTARASSVRADVADNRTAASQRLVVMVIDDVHLDKPREDKSKALAREVVDKIGVGASMAVLFTSGRHSTEITEDRSALMAAIDSLKSGQAERRPLTLHETGGQQANGQEFFQNIQSLKTIDDAARMLGQDDVRRKTFVMISEGVNAQMVGMFDNAMTPCEARMNPQTPRAGQPAVNPCGASMALHQTMEDLRRSNVSMYIVDPRGAVSEQDLDKENFPPPNQVVGVASRGRSSTPRRPTGDSPLRDRNPVRLAEDGMSIMAEASGGFAVTNTDAFDEGIQLIADDLNHYYVLGFTPTDPNGTEYRPLAVAISGHPDWVLRFRRGYLPGGPPAPPANSDPLISAVTPKTDLPLRLIAVPQPPTKASPNAHVALVLEIGGPKATLLDAQGLIHDDVSFQIVAVQAKKAQATARVANSAKLTLKAGSAANTSDTVAYTIPTAMDLAPGAYQLRASATSGQSHVAGSVYLNVDVPDFAADPLGIGGVAIGYSDGTRVAVASSETPQTDLALPFVPTLDRTFAPSDTLRVYAEVPRTNLTDAVKVTVSLLAASGGKSAASVAANINANEHGRVDVTVPLAGVAPGAYTLSLAANDGKHTATRELPITVK